MDVAMCIPAAVGFHRRHCCCCCCCCCGGGGRTRHVIRGPHLRKAHRRLDSEWSWNTKGPKVWCPRTDRPHAFVLRAGHDVQQMLPLSCS